MVSGYYVPRMGIPTGSPSDEYYVEVFETEAFYAGGRFYRVVPRGLGDPTGLPAAGNAHPYLAGGSPGRPGRVRLRGRRSKAGAPRFTSLKITQSATPTIPPKQMDEWIGQTCPLLLLLAYANFSSGAYFVKRRAIPPVLLREGGQISS
jgi:hypothetical protein